MREVLDVIFMMMLYCKSVIFRVAHDIGLILYDMSSKIFSVSYY